MNNKQSLMNLSDDPTTKRGPNPRMTARTSDCLCLAFPSMTLTSSIASCSVFRLFNCMSLFSDATCLAFGGGLILMSITKEIKVPSGTVVVTHLFVKKIVIKKT